jgi:hypothetical protein
LSLETKLFPPYSKRLFESSLLPKVEGRAVSAFAHAQEKRAHHE